MASRRYLNFDLLLEQEGEGRYQARVTASPLGEMPSVRFELPFDAMTLENLLLKLDPGRSGTRRVGATGQQQAAMDFGGPLYQAVFTGDVALAWQRSLDRVRAENAGGLRLRLRLTDAPAIAGLPWELLYDARTNSFLAQSERTPLVRFLEVPQVVRPMTVDGPLNILAVISSPIDLEELDVEAEWQRLEEALAPRVAARLVVLDRLPSATLAELGAWLRRHPTHVIHFVGHGDFDDRLREGVIYFQDQHGRSSPITSSVLGPYLRDHDPLRMVVLNACRSARSDAVDPFGGMAQGLVQQDATAVVAMQFPISDRAAVTFTGEFYGALVDGLPVDQAVSSARKALLADFRDEWSTPVLFMRSPDGSIFENVRAEPGDDDRPDRPGPSWWKSLWLLVSRHRRLILGIAAAVVALVVALLVVRALDEGADESGDQVSDPTGSSDPVDDGLPRSDPLAEDQILVGAGPDAQRLRIFLVDITGATPADARSPGGTLERLPVLSPDRDTVIFQRQRGRGNYELWVGPAGQGQQPRPLFARAPEECSASNGRPAWIPGQNDLVLRCKDSNEVLRMVRVDLSGEVEATYTARLSGETLDGIGDPTVSRDGGTLVVYAADAESELEGSLWAFDLSTGQGRPLPGLQAEGGVTYSDPVFSPTEDRLAWRADLGGDDGWEVQTATFANGVLGPVQSLSDGLDGDDRDPTFSPDGTRVVFAHASPSPNGTQQLYVANVSDNPDPQPIPTTGLPPFQDVPSWTRR